MEHGWNRVPAALADDDNDLTFAVFVSLQAMSFPAQKGWSVRRLTTRCRSWRAARTKKMA